MSSVFDQAFSLSQAITDQKTGEALHTLASIASPGVDAYSLDPLVLLNSFGAIFPNKAKLIIFDTPRASKRKAVSLYTPDERGVVSYKEVAHDDPAYKFLHTGNLLAYARALNQVLAEEGILLAITTPEVYMNVRGAIEHYLGSDKYIGELVYQSRSGGGADSTWLSTDHETLLIFSKNKSLISRFLLEKESDELAKYDLEDEESRYTWDTYIRKNARNYYKIEAPDGTILEKDEHGNLIPWLWKKATFIEALNKGDVKFEKTKGKWKLYYKDRLKDVKILRSISLNATVLNQIAEEFPTEMKGGALLNAKGSAEIAAFTGTKPDYLKPSDFYYFLFSVFNKSGGCSLIPFNEYGAAAEGANKFGKLREKLIINNGEAFTPLINWRVKRLQADALPQNSITSQAYTLADFFDDGEKSASLATHLISTTCSITAEWADFECDGFTVQTNENDSWLYVYVPHISANNLHALPNSLSPLFSGKNYKGLNVYTEFEPALVEKIFSQSEVTTPLACHQLPEAFLK